MRGLLVGVWESGSPTNINHRRRLWNLTRDNSDCQSSSSSLSYVLMHCHRHHRQRIIPGGDFVCSGMAIGWLTRSPLGSRITPLQVTVNVFVIVLSLLLYCICLLLFRSWFLITLMGIIIQIAISIIKVAKVRVHIRRFVPHQRELKWRKEVRISNLRQMSFKAFRAFISCVFIFTQCIFFLGFFVI